MKNSAHRVRDLLFIIVINLITNVKRKREREQISVLKYKKLLLFCFCFLFVSSGLFLLLDSSIRINETIEICFDILNSKFVSLSLQKQIRSEPLTHYIPRTANLKSLHELISPFPIFTIIRR